jgi:hypothetical protein
MRGGPGHSVRSCGMRKARERGKEAACNHPYPTVVLLRGLFDGGKQRCGGAASSRSAAAMAAAESGYTRVSRAEAAAAG